ncbi:Hypothetical predicted protein [Octopus vulgaris]|uniref:Uncharacterized protein n=1 Tax=Octopus vulgaris TaxID=6645 RepID=A0AA36AY19_OCTVU|nr:Hypothetical predicted protein [Octopus vulgaris]
MSGVKAHSCNICHVKDYESRLDMKLELSESLRIVAIMMFFTDDVYCKVVANKQIHIIHVPYGPRSSLHSSHLTVEAAIPR